MEKLGPTGHRVGRRLRELRQVRGFTLGDLEERLREMGRPILLSALSKIEKGQRRVDVDDLVALALALDVSPNLLLLPSPATSDTEVRLTESRSLASATAWSWAVKDRPPPTSARTIFISYSHRDTAWATWIAGCLAEAGFEVGFDSWDVAPGTDIGAYLVDRINQAACMVVLASESYLTSRWTDLELNLARDKELPILPVSVDDAAHDNGPLSHHNSVRIDVDSEIAAKKTLLTAVSKLGIRPRPAEAKPVFPSASTRSITRLFPRQRTLVACDIEGAHSRTSPALAALRADMYDLLETALLACNITEDVRDPLIDRGDGVLVAVHPTDAVPKTLLLNTFVPELSAALVEHATRHPDRGFRLRVAIHSGEVHFDRQGAFGEDIDIIYRLLDAHPLRDLQRMSDARLVLAVSNDIHRTVVRHAYDGIDPHAFTAFEVAYRTQRLVGWLMVPTDMARITR